MLRWVLLALFIGLCASSGGQKLKAKPQTPKPQAAKPQAPKALARGWGDNINWVKTYGEGLEKMAESQKPLMVIHHLEDCPHCKALKKVFAADKSIQKMAKEDFVMVNLVEETGDVNLALDGYYVPRILFVDPSKTVRGDITGVYGDRRYTYQPKDLPELAENMRKAKKLLNSQRTEL